MKVGDIVEWTSQGAGTAKTKRGKIFHVVPAGTCISKEIAQKALSRWYSDQVSWSSNLEGASRSEDSYLVVVAGTRRRFPRVYWPLTKWLRKARESDIALRTLEVPENVEQKRRALDIRRRTEDVKEGLRLDREAFKEVWE